MIDKQPQLQWLDMDAAIEHCAQGASSWEWAGNCGGEDADVVLACAGDVMTMETVAAAWWLRKQVPELKVRVVNVVDLMTLFPPAQHPHGMNETDFVNLFTADKHVIFAFHGYQRAMHQILHGRANPERFHVRGFIEQGTTTTPFDMLMLNKVSRYDLIKDVMNNVPKMRQRRPEVNDACDKLITQARAYSLEHMEDPPEIRDWIWTATEERG